MLIEVKGEDHHSKKNQFLSQICLSSVMNSVSQHVISSRGLLATELDRNVIWGHILGSLLLYLVQYALDP